MTDTPEDNRRPRDLNRRTVLVAGGATAVAVGLVGALAVDASAEDDTATGACYALTSEAVEGPYYIDADKIRQNVTEDQAGIPLALTLKVIDAETCRPLKNAAVDIWHCNAVGVYSGYEASGSGGGGGGPAPTGSPDRQHITHGVRAGLTLGVAPDATHDGG